MTLTRQKEGKMETFLKESNSFFERKRWILMGFFFTSPYSSYVLYRNNFNNL